MCGRPYFQRTILETADLDEWVPQDHPLGRIKGLAEVAQACFSPRIDAIYASRERALIKAEAGIKSFRPKNEAAAKPDRKACPGEPTVNIKGWQLRNDSHESRTDPETWLIRKVPGLECQAVLHGACP